jgi:hypothetical protein
MKKVILFFIFSCIVFLPSIKIFSQVTEIEIDSTFNSSFELFPFEQIENISGITMDGDVHLNSDTSLVRVILKDDNDIQYLILESYPLICPGKFGNFPGHCDETCFLEQVNPNSIIIQVIDATLNLKSFYYTTDPKENASGERYQAKRALDAEKIETMNQLIPSYNMNWVAGDNRTVALYYEQKRNMFGDGYNLRGFDYYSEGIFEFLGHDTYPKVGPGIVRSFDWRNRHGANDSLSLYWDGDDTLGSGWITKTQSQWPCGSCWAFGAVGAVEAIANLYSARHVDYDLSEQDLLSCSYAGGCDGGNEDTALMYIKYHGIVTENCFPYYGLINNLEIPCNSNLKCEDPDTIVKITDTLLYRSSFGYNFDSLRIKLITKGPLTIFYEEMPLVYHIAVLIGFEFDQHDSTLSLIIKNSNLGWGNRGFGKLKLDNYSRAIAIIPPILQNDTILEVKCHDYDHDGYCFWGIGPKPASCDTCDCFEEEDCDDNDSLVGGYDENYNCTCLLVMDSIPHHITGDSTWSDTTYVSYEVIIDSGASLTITSYAAFAPEAKIVVKQGARLIIDGGYLTKACPELWQGIEVYGSDTVQAFDQYFGHVIVQNNSIIEFAKNAIANHCTECGYVFTQSGGMINADSSIFRNNETDVLFAPFQNMWLGKEYPYFSYFTKCRFTTTAAFYPEFLPKAHIDLKDIYGPMIYGCTFENTCENDILYPIRGTGISCIDANFSLLEHCNSQNVIPCPDLTPCEFDGLEYGIKALNSRSVRTLYIQKVNFDENLVGISLSGIDNASILSNDIKCPRSIEGVCKDRFTGGLFMEGCSGYHIEGNYFHALSSMESGTSPSYGIGVKNSGPAYNEIYNNTFTKLKTGIIAIGENRGRDGSGLCLKCNDLSLDTNDLVVVVDYPPAGIQGIRLFQGNPNDTISETAPAGNTFTDLSGKPADFDKIINFNYYNGAEDIYYLHHLRQTYPLTYPLEDNYTIETIELHQIRIPYNKSRACPSGLGGGPLKSISSPRETIDEADGHICLLNNLLNALVDGGNTEELNIEVMTSQPDDGLELSQQLLYDSPYLSDTILKQVIYKEEVLPNAMIRDIMQANPQSAKKDDLLVALDERIEPMPDFMMVQVMEGKNYFGAKELLEAEIQSWQQIRSKAKYELMRQFLLDTTMVNPIDSVITFLETENDLESKYDLAFAYWDKQDTANAMFTINIIPVLFPLNGIQSAIHQLYIDYFGILEQIEDNHWRACDLDSSSVEELFNLMEDGNADLIAHARGLLVKGGFLKYIETVNLPDYTKSSGLDYYAEGKLDKNPQKDYLRLFPNPAGDYVIAYYRVELKFQSGMISIHDLKGNLIRKYMINPGENQMVLSLKDLPNGIYIIGLIANGHLIESDKLSKGGY